MSFGIAFKNFCFNIQIFYSYCAYVLVRATYKDGMMEHEPKPCAAVKGTQIMVSMFSYPFLSMHNLSFCDSKYEMSDRLFNTLSTFKYKPCFIISHPLKEWVNLLLCNKYDVSLQHYSYSIKNLQLERIPSHQLYQ